jgi:hypothetical protein
MTYRSSAAILLAIVLGGGLAGWWLARGTIPPEAPPAAAVKRERPVFVDSAPKPRSLGKRERGLIRDGDAADAGALENQRSLRFADREAYERFLAAAQGKGIAILGSIDRLNALHVGFLSLDELNALLDGSEESGFIYPVYLPTPKTEGVQEGAVGFGETLLSWLGIKGDNSAYGSGVKVAILDTGSTLEGARNQFLVPPPEDAADWNGHGTAVADLIRQIAPAADLYSWRVANDEGQSNSFLLAQGILAALDAGVDVINISMGSYGNSAILRDAVETARAANVLIYASGGNEGYEQLAYPAAYDGVIGVGAVDANGSYLNFSNTGNVTMTAPGLDLVTAWTGGQSVFFTGTSASAPIGVGVLAAAMSQGGTRISSSQAYRLVTDNLNEAGAPGTDSFYGIGMVDLGRVLQSGQPGITDAAIAANHVTYGNGGQPQLQVVIQNRGTNTLVNTPVEVTTPSGTVALNITTLQAGDIATFDLPLSFTGDSAIIQSRVQVSGGGSDLKPSNNRRTDVYTVPAAN